MFNRLRSEIKTHRQISKIIHELDERLLNALFEPGVRANFYSHLLWKDPNTINRGNSLLDQLGRLSEYYQTINPQLSAAIWGIWDAVCYFRQYRTFFFGFFESKRKGEQLFVDVRALIATAAMRFPNADGYKIVPSPNRNNIALYQENAEDAIRQFEELLVEP
jgi:hypothetical protein